MSVWLKQSSSIEVKVGPFVDSVDGVTPETALTITSAEVLLAKNEGDYAAKNESTSVVHESNGWYRCLLNTTDTNTLGILRLQIAESGALPVWAEYMVVAANVYDSFFSTDLLQVDATELLGTAFATPTVAGVIEADVTHLGGVAQSATDLKDFADAGYDPATNKVEGVKLVDLLTALVANAISDASVSTDMDQYAAKVWMNKEGTTADKYGVIWFKNGTPITSGVTSPTIQVIKASDGTDLIASTAMTEVGSHHIFKKEETTNKTTAGDMYWSKVQATIDGSTRTWFQPVPRDS